MNTILESRKTKGVSTRAASAGLILLLAAVVCFGNSQTLLAAESAPQWQVVELEFTADKDYENAYTEVEFWVDFLHEDGTELRRPGFWDGGRSFKVRFASPLAEGTWSWQSFANVPDDGLRGHDGSFATTRSTGSTHFAKHGF